MKYENHIFISYSHSDNELLTTEQEGWVSRFEKNLKKIVERRSGREVTIWRDQMMGGNRALKETIFAQFPKTEMLLSILSPCYLESSWCLDEVKEFCERCGKVKVGDTLRIITVKKLPIELGSLPPPINETLGCQFYTMREARIDKCEHGEHAFELDPSDPDLMRLYYQQMIVLADDIRKTMAAVESGNVEPAPPVPQSRRVYLAACSWDLEETRQAIENDLRQQEYSVYPCRLLPTEESAFTAEVSRLLEQCRVSIHLVGKYGGFVPNGRSGKSAVVLQNELAIAQAKKEPSLRRVIWLPEGTDSKDAQQQQFIEALNVDSEKQFGADLISGDLEALKSAIYATLRSLEQKDLHGIEPQDPEARLLYMIYDNKDREAVLPIRKFLKREGFDLEVPLFEGNAEALDQAKRKMLTTCRGVLVFYGKGDEAWKYAVNCDLKKSRGYRWGAPNPVTVTYLAEPSTVSKAELIELEGANLINGLEGFSENVQKALLECLKEV
jgi:hypothetical protein